MIMVFMKMMSSGDVDDNNNDKAIVMILVMGTLVEIEDDNDDEFNYDYVNNRDCNDDSVVYAGIEDVKKVRVHGKATTFSTKPFSIFPTGHRYPSRGD